MGPRMQRFVGAIGTIAVAAAVNVATGFLADHKALKWWVSGAALLVVGIAIQWWLPVGASNAPVRQQKAVGNQVGGSLIQKMPGAGAQTAEQNKVKGDFTQVQDK